MKRGNLSIEDHRKVSAEIIGILDAHSRILALINGKVPVKILNQLLSMRGVDKATHRLRSDLEDEMFRRHRDTAVTTSIYYPGMAARVYSGDGLNCKHCGLVPDAHDGLGRCQR